MKKMLGCLALFFLTITLLYIPMRSSAAEKGEPVKPQMKIVSKSGESMVDPDIVCERFQEGERVAWLCNDGATETTRTMSKVATKTSTATTSTPQCPQRRMVLCALPSGSLAWVPCMYYVKQGICQSICNCPPGQIMGPPR